MMNNIMLKDALRYMGMPVEHAEKELVDKVEATYRELAKLAQPRATYQKLSIHLDEINKDKVIFENTPVVIE